LEKNKKKGERLIPRGELISGRVGWDFYMGRESTKD
jgi:hypothetical protein